VQKKYAVVKIAGGLGNQLFQYCFARHLSLHLQVDIKLDISFYSRSTRSYLLEDFMVILDKVDREKLHNILKWKNLKLFKLINTLLPIKYKKYYREKVGSDGIDKNVYEAKRALFFEGYWQNKGYFESSWKIIKKELRLKKRGDAYDALQKKIEATNAVAIHFRRGDYVSNERIFQQHGTCSVSYYENAVKKMSTIISSPVFFIFSDDIEWVKKNFVIKQPVEFVSNERVFSPSEELVLMSKCKHAIISNSTFSWWGAWLNEHDGKVVIAPSQWSKTITTKFINIVPPAWIRL